MVLPHLRWRVPTVTGGQVNNRYGSVIADAATGVLFRYNCATRNPGAKQAKPLTIYADGFDVSHLTQEAFGATEVRKGGSQCSFSRKVSRIEIF